MPTTATAAIVSEPYGPFTLQTVELDDPGDEEVLVRIEACGICHTDIKVQQRLSLPAVLGHEGTGIVEKTGKAVTRVKPGDRVILSYPFCGECSNCRSQQTYRCEEINRLKFAGKRADGTATIKYNDTPLSSAFFQQSAFATHAITLERSVVPLNGDEPPELFAALPCGVQTGAGAVINSLRAQAGRSLVIFGTGTVGLSAVMAAKQLGVAPLIAVDMLRNRLDMALELGATHVINSTQDDALDAIRSLLPRGVDYTLDTTGDEKVMNQAVDSLAMGGQCGMVATPNRIIPFNLFAIFSRAATLHGIIQGHAVSRDFIPKLLDMYRDGGFPCDRLITAYDFADINQAVDDVKSGRTIKPVLVMSH